MDAVNRQTHLERGKGPHSRGLSAILDTKHGRQSDGDIASVLKTRQETI
jgi:hypothetical protein